MNVLCHAYYFNMMNYLFWKNDHIHKKVNISDFIVFGFYVNYQFE